MQNAKVICTLGPASSDPDTIRALATAGMSVARINASHGEPGDRAALIDLVKQVDQETDQPVSSLLDLQGPEVRTGNIDETIHLAADDRIRFVTHEPAEPHEIEVSLDLSGVAPGGRILIDDGRIETVVEAVDDAGVAARVVTGGELESRKGVNVPGTALDIETVTDKDRADIEIAVEHEVDFIAASFVQNAADVIAVSEAVENHGGDLPIIAKIERAEAISNLPGIIDAAYGVMIARGDLGVECPLEEVPLIQKRIIRRCQRAGVPVITATEMLDSMIHRTRPTRAEASDVANAVLDGTDAVMLSGETAIGDHPVRVVETMSQIIREVEVSDEYAELREQRIPPVGERNADAIARSARYLARDVGARAIVVASESGYTALKTSKYRPAMPIIAAIPDDRVRRQLALSWGVRAQYADLGLDGPAGVIEDTVRAALKSRVVESGDTVVVLSGMMTELDLSTTNTLKVHVATERLGTGRGVVGGRAVGPLVRSDTGALQGVPAGVVLYLSAEFDGELTGDYEKLAGVLHERPGMTGYPAMVARELGVPMASGVVLRDDVPDDTVVTLDGERGVVYRGDITPRAGDAGGAGGVE